MGKRERVTTEQIQHELSETAEKLPIVSQLRELFTDRKMFDSMNAFEKAGFRLIAHSPHKIMSGSHKLTSGYLFKKAVPSNRSRTVDLETTLRI